MRKTAVIASGCLLSFWFLVMGNAAAQQALKATIESVKGEVETKLMNSNSWQPAHTGMILKKGDSLSTGFDAEALLKFEDNSKVTVNSLTILTIDEFFREGPKVKTNLAMKSLMREHTL